MTGKLTDVTDANFKAEVLDADGPVLVDFWAPWCGPCRVVHPVLEEIDAERDDLRIVSINVDENQQTAANYEVLSIPTMILFKDGAIAKKVVGAMPKRRLEAELEPALAYRERRFFSRAMPFVEVHWFEGRSDEQKAEVAKRIQEALTDVAGASPDHCWVKFSDSSKSDFIIGEAVD